MSTTNNFSRLKNNLQLFSILFFSFLTLGCNLGIQDSYNFVPSYESAHTFGEQTAWEWLSAPPNNEDKATNEELNYMKASIELTGLIDLYNNKSAKRTFFMITDAGFDGVLNELSIQYSLEQLQDKNDILTKDIVKLRNILKYHIIDTYIDQGEDEITGIDASYYFDTLSEDPNNGTIEISKAWYLDIIINTTDVANRRKVVVDKHNFVFSNGNTIAHMINSYARRDAFSSLTLYDGIEINADLFGEDSNGFGWSAPWEQTSGTSISTLNNSLSYPVGVDAQTYGKSILATGENTISRSFLSTIPLSNTSFYLSYLVKRNSEGSVKLVGVSGANTRYGLEITSTGGLIVQASTVFGAIAENKITEDTTYLIVLEKKKGTTRVKVFSDIDSIPSDSNSLVWDAEATGVTGVSIDRFEFQLNKVEIDELRLGSTFTSVTKGDPKPYFE